MIIKNEVKLHQESIDYVKKTLGQYKLVEKLEDEINNPIIHMYPVVDAYEEDGELNRSTDSIFFRVDIYDTIKMTVYKGKRLHDQVMPFSDINVSQIKIFKDLSTLLSFYGKYTVSEDLQSVSVYSKLK
jgi:hypothetical protein